MIYAPILIPTLCRYKHFIVCVESLKKNPWAKYTDIYVALDYPAKPEHFEGYRRICAYLQGSFIEFASFNIIRRTENYGSARNSRELISFVLQNHDRFIRTDDDAEFSPNFIEYMDKSLEYYENKDDVVAVNGYSYPIKWRNSDGCNTVKSNLLCTMWGVGFWRDKYIDISEQLRNGYLVKRFDSAISDRSYKHLSHARFLSFITAGLAREKGLILSSSDIAWGTYLALSGKYVVLPTLSKVRNHGFDGTGVYCQDISSFKNKSVTALNYDYENQPIDMETSFSLRPDDSTGFNLVNKHLLNRFDKRSIIHLCESKLKLFFYRTIGKNNYFTLRDKFYNAKHTHQ